MALTSLQEIRKIRIEKIIKLRSMGINPYPSRVTGNPQKISEALKQTDNLMLENHLRSCVSDAIQAGQQDQVIAEVLEIFKKSEVLK